MTAFRFPDNTVLCTYAAVDRLDLLRDVLGGHGRWTSAVSYEASRSAQFLGGLTDLRWLGEPIEITDTVQIRRIHQVRRAVFGGTDEEPLRHLGEAETCFLLTDYAEFRGSWWISDDQEALRYARHQGITTRETIDLISESVVTGDVTAQEAFDLLHAMADRGRTLRLPATVAELRR